MKLPFTTPLGNAYAYGTLPISRRRMCDAKTVGIHWI